MANSNTLPFPVKHCTRCKTVKFTTEFQKCADNRDGLSNHCKVCCSAKQAAYRHANMEKTREYDRKYYHERKD
jgi:recombinational DNA repair protein RecR